MRLETIYTAVFVVTMAALIPWVVYSIIMGFSMIIRLVLHVVWMIRERGRKNKYSQMMLDYLWERDPDLYEKAHEVISNTLSIYHNQNKPNEKV